MLALLAGCVERELPVDGRPAAADGPAVVIQALTVAEIRDHLENYRDQEVTVAGTATPGLAFEFVDEQPYSLDDGSGTIWVITRAVAPARDSRVTVRGTLRAPYQIKGRSYELAVIEVERVE